MAVLFRVTTTQKPLFKTTMKHGKVRLSTTETGEFILNQDNFQSVVDAVQDAIYKTQLRADESDGPSFDVDLLVLHQLAAKLEAIWSMFEQPSEAIGEEIAVDTSVPTQGEAVTVVAVKQKPNKEVVINEEVEKEATND